MKNGLYEKRRQKVFEKIQHGSLVILPSNPKSIRSRDTEYLHRQNSDILYLTGFSEPESILVLQKNLDGETKTILFVNPKNKEEETWHGRRIGPEYAVSHFNVNEAYSNVDFKQWTQTAFEENFNVYYPLAMDFSFDQQLLESYKLIAQHRSKNYIGVSRFIDSSIILSELRLIKDETEIDIMRKAASISAEAHIEAMKKLKSGMYEYEIESIVNSYFRSKGANGPAYPSIVATGENATILHYVQNSDQCKEGQLLLIDAGAEYKYYAADITRTYPVSGKFTILQRELYEIVLNAQKSGIKSCYPSNTFQNIHKSVVRVLTESLVDLELLNGDIDELIDKESYKPYYMHGTSHWLGLDTHDVGFYKIPKNQHSEPEERILEPGMVLTIEPGLYFSSYIENLPAKFHGIGIRIEDDILITENGLEILSKDVPKEVDAIEALMRS